MLQSYAVTALALVQRRRAPMAVLAFIVTAACLPVCKECGQDLAVTSGVRPRCA